VKPGAGTWAWDGSYKFGTNISYTCGPYGNFQAGFSLKLKKIYFIFLNNFSYKIHFLDFSALFFPSLTF
jgi:hypothetical protein